MANIKWRYFVIKRDFRSLGIGAIVLSLPPRTRTGDGIGGVLG